VVAVLGVLDSSWREEERFRIDGHSPSGARPPPPPESRLGALCVSETASRTGVEELEEEEEGLDGADEGDVGAAARAAGDGLAGLPDLRSVDWDLFPAAGAAAFGEGCRLGVVAGAAGVDGRPAFGEGCLLGVAGLRLRAASSSSWWPLA
jgi:hypothetical protein